ncbi:replication restart helicase PriA [Candidatus Phytoplasma fabacearum]|uniref:replication restart helicase PriA n=1 Tax=Candidatus Phytoplasma fabacearum TaxID=2982628 RepID=UPI0027136256|nr:primosomal protein N' ['Bituminaria bituminosa' little leaf phytoplasma]MDV3154017.1 primosomal protein N' [Pigeon pea little leaf phytoplasma]MDO7983487.1 primosomal protein N' ['Bituminaria bituminosa' little leaf phytoplasma]MDO8030503.1 primosomal protein N' ['Bituminaria bituminosa' little leaf phytoplasma]MDV3163285.1 primosomal protein N' [Pigeon pea little leaf phytoplasma]MDV3164366.1 primosomal protein N' [Pigeon pea little leaf phytoplasma]
MIAEILIDLSLNSNFLSFDYIIPEKMINLVQIGTRVIIPLNNTVRLGYVLAIKENSIFANKEIIEVLDLVPFLNQEFFLLIDELLKIPLNSKISVYRTVLPKELLTSYVRRISILKSDLVPAELKKYLNDQKFLLNVKSNFQMDLLRKLKKEKIIEISIVPKKEISQLSFHHIKSLIYQEKIEDKSTGINDPINSLNKREISKVYLTIEQKNIFNKLFLDRYQTYLLIYSLECDKLQIYWQLIQENLKKQKQILILMPEIILIERLVEKIKIQFPDIVIFINHGGQISNKTNNNFKQSLKFDLVIGTNIAVFTPFMDLGVIIIDDEHHNSFIEKIKMPFYDARELAKLRANYHKVPLILSSLSPSLTSYYRAKKLGEYVWLNLKKTDIKYDIQLIDMKKELQQGNLSPLSSSLIELLIKNLKSKSKSLLFVNIKGFSRLVLCFNCGYIPKCLNCDRILHSYINCKILKCSFCDYKEKFSEYCSLCEQKTIASMFSGILSIENFLKKQIPEAFVDCIDSDNIRNFNIKEYNKIISNIKDNKVDIYLGTTMIIKNGISWPISLLGIVFFDALLNISHFTAKEKAFQILVQLIYNMPIKSRILIQTYNINNYILKSIVNNDFDYFYEKTLEERQISGYPPFTLISKFLIMHRNFFKAQEIAQKLKIILQNNLSINIANVLGPSIAKRSFQIINKKNFYRVFLTLKYKNWPLDLDFLKKYHFDKNAYIIFDRFDTLTDHDILTFF